MGRIAAQASAWLHKTFPERQIYHQAKGELRFIRIGTMQQTVAAAAGLALGIWLLVATLGATVSGVLLGRGAVKLASMEARYAETKAEAEARVHAAHRELERRSADLKQTILELERRQKALESLARAGGLTPAAAGAAPAAPQAVDPADAKRAADALKAKQEAFLRQTDAAARARAAAARQTLGALGISRSVGPRTGQGGPFIPLDSVRGLSEPDPARDFHAAVRHVSRRVQEAAALEGVVDSAPLGAPVGVPASMTSDYGPRIDPITRRPGWHGGVDLVAFHGAPIVATAKGVVSFVGWKSGYGKTIDIDHGNGFKTRYAHLSSYGVREGQVVADGQRIAALGNTGRSTGPHLHYEVIIDGDTRDPARFIRAAE